jgi:hypothetical protein
MILSILPIFDIFISSKLQNVVCKPTLIPAITLNSFLLYKGIFTILNLFLIGFFKVTKSRSTLDKCVTALYVVTGLFNFVWLILGSILFWRDCPNVKPQNLNFYLWFTLVVGYVSIFAVSSNTLSK